MLKRLLPMAASVILVSGCLAGKEFSNLGSTLQKGTFLVRSLTLFDPSAGDAERVKVFMGWVTTSGGSLSAITRKAEGALVATSLEASKAQGTSFTDEDDDGNNNIDPGTAYTYEVTVGSTTLPARTITPRRAPTGTSVTITNPSSTDPLNPTALSTKPTFAWTLDPSNTPNGLIVNIGETTLDSNFNPSFNFIWTGMFDAASQSTGVAYGAKSNIPGLSDDVLLTGALKGINPELAPTEGEAPALVATKNGNPVTYIIKVTPIMYDADKTTFGIGRVSDTSTVRYFRVQ